VTLSIIIVTYNVSDHLHYCLLSVAAAIKNIEAEIIIVDNNSPENTLDLVKKRFPGVRLIENATNDGFSKACNQGAAIAKGEHLLFLNPDTIVGENTIEYVLGHLQNQPKVGAAGVMMLDGAGRYLKESKRGIPDTWNSFCKMLGLTSIFPGSYIFSGYHAGHLANDKEHAVPVLSGAFFMVKATAFREVGGFDERFFMYGEDIDLSMLLVKNGYINLYLPLSPILHFKGRSSVRNSDYVHRFYKAMLQFIDKYYASLFQLPVNILLKLSVLVKRSLALYAVQRGGKSKKASIPDTSKSFRYVYGDEQSCLEFEREENNPLIQFVSDPSYAEQVVLCQGPHFSFGSLIEYIRTNPSRNYSVHALGLKGSVS